MNNETKNNVAWRELFNRHDILNRIDSDGKFIISASQIGEFREARLMTKFDHKINLPSLFKENNLAILPISRGDYVISNYKVYKDFQEINSTITYLNFPGHIESIDISRITSEANAINCAFVSGILSDFLEDESLLPTVSGRMSSGNFNFEILNNKHNNKETINVANSQIEIDGGFEGLENLTLIEAKNSLSDDFLVRQLYYPFRLWEQKINKKVIPLFMTYSNSIFSLYEYKFENPNDYNSIILTKQKNYSFEDTEISDDDIVNVFNQVIIINEPQIPFPQADKFDRVIDLCEHLLNDEMSIDEITEKYAFDKRQADYYATAARYLGLIEKNESNRAYKLTNYGTTIFRKDFKNKQLELVKAIFSHKVFYDIFREVISSGHMPERALIISIMKNNNLYNINSDETYNRRASTILGWINWIVDLYLNN